MAGTKIGKLVGSDTRYSVDEMYNLVLSTNSYSVCKNQFYNRLKKLNKTEYTLDDLKIAISKTNKATKNELINLKYKEYKYTDHITLAGFKNRVALYGLPIAMTMGKPLKKKHKNAPNRTTINVNIHNLWRPTSMSFT